MLRLRYFISPDPAGFQMSRVSLDRAAVLDQVESQRTILHLVFLSTRELSRFVFVIFPLRVVRHFFLKSSL